MVKPVGRPCLQCGNVHWSTQPCPPDTRPKAKFRADNPLADKPSIGRRYSLAEVERERNASVTPSQQRNATVTGSRNAPVTCPQCKELRAALKAERAEREALQAEVKTLKLELAQSHGGKAKPMTNVERVRKWRATKAKRDGTVQFKG